MRNWPFCSVRRPSLAKTSDRTKHRMLNSVAHDQQVRGMALSVEGDLESCTIR